MLCHSGGSRVLQMMPQVRGLRFARVPVSGRNSQTVVTWSCKATTIWWAVWASHVSALTKSWPSSRHRWGSESPCTSVVQCLYSTQRRRGRTSSCSRMRFEGLVQYCVQNSWPSTAQLKNLFSFVFVQSPSMHLVQTNGHRLAASVERRVGTYSPTTSSKLWSIFSIRRCLRKPEKRLRFGAGLLWIKKNQQPEAGGPRERAGSQETLLVLTCCPLEVGWWSLMEGDFFTPFHEGKLSIPLQAGPKVTSYACNSTFSGVKYPQWNPRIFSHLQGFKPYRGPT